jgi:hypothetical protein
MGTQNEIILQTDEYICLKQVKEFLPLLFIARVLSRNVNIKTLIGDPILN